MTGQFLTKLLIYTLFWSVTLGIFVFMGPRFLSAFLWAGWVVIFYGLFGTSPRKHRFTIRSQIHAPRGAVWNACCGGGLADPLYRAVYPRIVAIREIDPQEKIYELDWDVGIGRREIIRTVRQQTLFSVPPESCGVRVLCLNDQPFPFGDDDLRRFTLSENGGGTSVEIMFNGEIASIAQYIIEWIRTKRFLGQLKRVCESHPGVPSIQSSR